jgi:hypothetical protein
MIALVNAWIVLSVLTLVAMGAGAVPGVSVPGVVQVGIVLAVAGLKASTILRYFLGLRTASGGWRILFALYLIVLCGAMFAIYAAGHAFAPHPLPQSGGMP